MHLNFGVKLWQSHSTNESSIIKLFRTVLKIKIEFTGLNQIL